MAQQTRINFKNGVVASIFTNVYKLIKGNIVRDKFTTLADSAVFPEDGDQPGGFLKIDNDNKVNVAFIKKNVPSGQFLKDNGTWGTVDTTTPAAAAESNAKAYADSLVIGLLDDRGNFDASVNLFPATGGSGAGGAILKGDIWTVSVAGVVAGVIVKPGDTLRALINSPAQVASNWAMTPLSGLFVGVKKLLFYQNTDSSVTGTTTETILTPSTFFIPGGTMRGNSILHVEAFCRRGSASTLGIITFSVKVNTSYSRAGAKLIHSTGSIFQTTIRTAGLIGRVVNKNNASVNNQPGISSPFMDTQSTNTATATNIDWSVDQYVMITATLANSGDTGTLDNVQFYITHVE